MKKLIYIFGILALALVGAACDRLDNRNSPGEETRNGIKPVLPLSIGETGDEIDTEITAFFEKHLPKYPDIGFQSIFFPDADDLKNICLTFNCIDELREIIPASVELPASNRLLMHTRSLSDNVVQVAAIIFRVTASSPKIRKWH